MVAQPSSPTFHVRGRPLKLGILATELFDPTLTGVGGFGWAVRQVSRCFSEEPRLGVETVLLMAWTVPPEKSADRPTLHGSRVLWRSPRPLDQVRRLHAEKIDLLLAIDNARAYRLVTWALPRTPVVFWIRDPWSTEAEAKLRTLRIPGEPTPPLGIGSRVFPSFRWDVRLARATRRPMLFAAPARLIEERMPGAYGFAPRRMSILPNPIDAVDPGLPRSARPSVVVVGRLDPVKRPWVAVRVAAALPDVDFHFLGMRHFSGAGSWEPGELPANVHLHGHLDGARKAELVAGAWALLNTSIHEGLPVTFLEALAAGTPIVSCLDPDGVTSRFGLRVGWAPGDGLELVPPLVAAVRRIVDDAGLRDQLGRAGREWVSSNHSRRRFLEEFHLLCREAGVLA